MILAFLRVITYTSNIYKCNICQKMRGFVQKCDLARNLAQKIAKLPTHTIYTVLSYVFTQKRNLHF